MKQNTPKSVAIDNNVLAYWVAASEDTEIKRKLDYFFESLEKNKQRLIVPAPVVAEFLVHAFDARYPFLEKLRQSSSVTIASFDYMAAMECAILTASAISSGDKKYGGNSPVQKIKVDEQIVATAKVRGANFILSDDDDIKKISSRFGISCKSIKELDMPPIPLKIAGISSSTDVNQA